MEIPRVANHSPEKCPASRRCRSHRTQRRSPSSRADTCSCAHHRRWSWHSAQLRGRRRQTLLPTNHGLWKEFALRPTNAAPVPPDRERRLKREPARSGLRTEETSGVKKTKERYPSRVWRLLQSAATFIVNGFPLLQVCGAAQLCIGFVSVGAEISNRSV